jgi:uncharacterized membrane protein
MDAGFSQILDYATRFIELIGISVIVVGIVVAGINFLRHRAEAGAYHELRSTLGRAILLGLELLVAADIINTVAIEPTLETLAVLAGIVLIRTFLSFSLEVEIEGKWPWQRVKDGRRSGASAPHRDPG